jgi:hypothetical protein
MFRWFTVVSGKYSYKSSDKHYDGEWYEDKKQDTGEGLETTQTIVMRG